jgi:hypothetical protein
MVDLFVPFKMLNTSCESSMEHRFRNRVPTTFGMSLCLVSLYKEMQTDLNLITQKEQNEEIELACSDFGKATEKSKGDPIA